MTAQRQVSTSRTIAADRQTLFDVIADPAMHPRVDGSGTVRATRDEGPDRLALGARFGMDMRVGTSYRITNTVVEFEEGRRIAWHHFHGHRWRYEFADVDGGTRVTETFDWSGARAKLLLRLARYPRRNLRAMRATLQRLDALVTGDAAAGTA